MIPSRSIENTRRIRFGTPSNLVWVPLFVGILPLGVSVTLAESISSDVIRGIAKAGIYLCSVVSLFLIVRLWFRLYLRVDYPVLEIGQPGGVAVFDLSDPAVRVEILGGVLTAVDTTDGRTVRAWGVNGERSNRSGSCYLHMERIASQFRDLLRDKNGATVVFSETRPPQHDFELERLQPQSWSEYRKHKKK